MRVLVLGASGFVGKWVVRKLEDLQENVHVFGASRSRGCDLRDKSQVAKLFSFMQPDAVINCAADVGGIQYGYLHPAELFYNNLQMTVNIFEACKDYKVKRLIQPVSNCAYPAKENFFQEDRFWDGPVHESVFVYGMSRRMMCVGSWAYRKQYNFDSISLVHPNMYGPDDHFDEVRSHALGALIKKIVKAHRENTMEVVIWGTGNPIREWLYVEDGALSLVKALNIPPFDDIINVGAGSGVSMKELACLIKDVVGWKGKFFFDTSKPDGATCKTLDGTRGRELLGLSELTPLTKGIRETVQFYLDSLEK